jgi:hypothetical protein
MPDMFQRFEDAAIPWSGVAAAVTTPIAVQVGVGWIGIVTGVSASRTAGAAAATYSLELYDQVDGTPKGTAVGLVWAGTVGLAIATKTNIRVLNQVCQADASGNIYVQPNPNVLGDTFTGILYVRRSR